MSDNLPNYDAWKEHDPRDDYAKADADDDYDEDLELDDEE